MQTWRRRPPRRNCLWRRRRCARWRQQGATTIAASRRGSSTRRRLEPIPVGQCVYYYAPPSGTKKTTAGDRNADYVKLYKGPATVVVRLSNVGYVVRHDKTNALAYRHRQHLRPVDRDYVTKGQDSAAAFE